MANRQSSAFEWMRPSYVSMTFTWGAFMGCAVAACGNSKAHDDGGIDGPVCSTVSPFPASSAACTNLELPAPPVIQVPFTLDVVIGDFNNDAHPDMAVLSAGEIFMPSAMVDVRVFVGTGTGAFQQVGSYPTGISTTNGLRATAADIDRDGNLDVAIGGVLLFGNGDGALQMAVDSGRGVFGVFGDLDGDGDLDLVRPGAGASLIGVSRNNGDGTFASETTFPAGFGFIELDDVNGDGKLDVVSGRDSQIDVLLGNGDATLGPVTSFDVGGPLGTFSVGDVTGDSKPDVIVGRRSTAGTQVFLSTLTGAGDGTFPTRTDEELPVSQLLARDVSGDGKVDIIYTRGDAAGSGFVVRRSNGDGTFQPDAAHVTAGYPEPPRVVQVADVDGNGRPDVVLLHNTGNGPSMIAIAPDDGAGGFRVSDRYDSVGVEVGLGDFVAADVNDDGIVDAIVGDGETRLGAITVRLGQADGTLGARADYNVASPPTPVALAVGDVDVDGHPDIVATYFSSSGADGWLSVLHGRGDGSFEPPKRIGGALPDGAGAQRLALGDLDGDGRLDIVAATGNGPSVPYFVVLLNEGTAGTFPTQVPYTIAGPAFPRDIRLHDVDGDCRDDVVVADGARCSISIWRNLGSGAFSPPVEQAFGPDLGGLIVAPSVEFADVDVDGIDDAVVAWAYSGDGGTSSPAVTVLRGQGGGGFAAYSDVATDTTGPLVHPLGFGATSIAVADMDGDSIPDIVFADVLTDTVGVLRGIGNGSFEPVRRFSTVDNPSRLRIVDIDRDGVLDVLVVGRSTPGFVPSTTTLGVSPGRCL